MREYYALGVKLALADFERTLSSQSTSSSGIKVPKPDLPKPKKPKLPDPSKSIKKPNVSAPTPQPTRAPDTGPFGARYGGIGTSARKVASLDEMRELLRAFEANRT